MTRQIAGAFAFAAMLHFAGPAISHDTTDGANGVKDLETGELSVKSLNAPTPWPPEDVISGSPVTRDLELHRGGQTVGVWEGGPAKYQLNDYPYDQYVHVLFGSLRITDDEGHVSEFNGGDHFLLQKGFTGTWEMVTPYREIYVIATPDLEANGE